ncbi:MAG: FUSC family protein [Sarcina sp.]
MTKSLAFKGWIVGVIALLTFLPFGFNNIIVAMASILLIPELAKNDYTTTKWKESLKLVITCFILSLAASLFMINIIIGSIVTFIIAFYIYYNHTYEDRESTGMIFIIYYILILSIPIKLNELPMRLGATVYGAILAMVLYYLLFKLNFLNVAHKNVQKYFEETRKNISEKLKGNMNVQSNLKLLQDTETALMRKAESSKNNKAKISEKLTIVEVLKSIEVLVDNSKDEKILSLILLLIDSLEGLYNGTSSLNDVKREAESAFKNLNIENQDYTWIKESMRIFFENYKDVDDYDFYQFGVKKTKSIIQRYSKEFNLDYTFHFSMESIKFNVAIKGALLISLAVFIVYHFNLPDGRWLLYTVVVVYLPFTELSVTKLRKRIFGTLIGFILFDILLFISQNTLYIAAIMLVSIYFSIYFVDYGKRAIAITYTGIASQYIVDKTQPYYILSFYRIGYVVIGAIIAFVVVQYIFPITMKKRFNLLCKSYNRLNEMIIDNVREKDISMSLREVLIVSKLLSMKGKFLSKYANNEKLNTLLDLESKITGEYKYLNYFKDVANLKSYLEEENDIQENIKAVESLIEMDNK